MLSLIKSNISLIKRLFLHITETLQRFFRVGNYWYWAESKALPNEILINEIVFPYRYDILVRKAFFEMYSSKHDYYSKNIGTLLNDALKSEYYIWFEKVLVRRYRNDLLNDAEQLKEAFFKRVRKSASLYDAMLQNGFDKKFPILLYTAHEILAPSDSGPDSGAIFMGDGCHRLACLMCLGFSEIPREYVRVKCYKQYRPFNNTELLAPYIEIANDWDREKK